MTSTPLPAAAPAAPVDHYAHLMERIVTRRDELMTVISTPDFYIQIISLVLAIVVAKSLAFIIHGRVTRALARRPMRLVGPDFFVKPLTLLAPVLTLLLFTCEKIAFELMDISSGWVDAGLQISFAYILARGVLLVVRTRFVARFIATVIMIIATIKAMRFLKSTTAFLDSMAFDFGTIHFSMLGIFHGLVVLVIVFWIATALARTLEGYLRRSSTLSYNTRELIVKCFRIFVYCIAIIITLNAAGVDLTAFAVFGGALGVGIGLGLQKLTSNFVSSVTLLMEKSIKIGDLVEVAGFTGWVRKLNTRYALLETFDGRDVMIPNEVMVSTNLTNWTYTSTRASIDIKVLVDYDGDAVKAHALMIEAALENPHCLKDPKPSCYLREFNEHGMVFLLTFWIADIKKGRSAPQSDVMFSILKKFAQEGIHMPRSQTVINMPKETLP